MNNRLEFYVGNEVDPIVTLDDVGYIPDEGETITFKQENYNKDVWRVDDIVVHLKIISKDVIYKKSYPRTDSIDSIKELTVIAYQCERI